MRYCITAELNIGTVSLVSDSVLSMPAKDIAYFFMIIHRKAFPSVWSSFSNANDAAVSVEPGS